jgi:hypothetical protein
MKIIPFENTTCEVSYNRYYAIYILYYVGQIDDLGIHSGPIHQTGGSMLHVTYGIQNVIDVRW